MRASYGKPKRYLLGEPFQKTYFTPREAQCMMLLLKRKTYKQIGALLNLSPRTIEFYVFNMKEKLACKTIPELIAKVKQSELMNQLSEIETMIKKSEKS